MSSLPPRLSAWLAPLVPEPEPERLATCDACAMCAKPGTRPGPGHFRPDTKCCTYQPWLPNFAVGAILRDPGALARDRLRARIATGPGVDPRGVGPPRHWELLYSRAPFGRTRAMLCPWYEDGRCGVWAHREAVCATYFCKHERGDAGERWWIAAKRFLEHVEEALAEWCVLELDPGPEARKKLVGRPAGDYPPEDFDGAASPEERAARWGRWAGDVERYYLACADLVATVDPARVLELCGPAVRMAAKNLLDEEAAKRKVAESA